MGVWPLLEAVLIAAAERTRRGSGSGDGDDGEDSDGEGEGEGELGGGNELLPRLVVAEVVSAAVGAWIPELVCVAPVV